MELKDIFPYEYASGGYFRLKGVPKKEKAPILHGEEAIKFVFEIMKKKLIEAQTSEKQFELDLQNKGIGLE